MNRPDFATLTPLSGHPQLRFVNGQWMDREQYDTEQWHVVKEETTEDGQPYLYWRATLGGLIRYGRLLYERDEERYAVARTRREQEDEFRDYVESLDDAKARYGK